MNTERLKEIGSEWEKNGMHRIYFNDLATWFGLETTRYNTGNISSAKFDGEKISNSHARGIASRFLFEQSKVWFDYSDENFHGKNIEQADFNKIVGRIKEAAEE